MNIATAQVVPSTAREALDLVDAIRAEFRKKVTDLVTGSEALTDDEFWEHAGDLLLAALNDQSKARRAARRPAGDI